MTNRDATVLIVDDEPAMRDTLEGLLGVEGYRIILARTGEEGLTLARGFQPDLVLLDVMMPEMDGYEVCRNIRQDPETAQIPVVMVTALEDRESRLRGIQSGADDFVSKPFDRAELRARVRTITRLNRYRTLLVEASRFRWVLEDSEDGHLLIDANGQVLFANPAACLYLECASLEPGRHTLQELIDARYQCEPEAAWQAWTREHSRVSVAPLYLVRPETAIHPALWLEVERFRPARLQDSETLVRLRDVTAEVTVRRSLWEFHTALARKLRAPLADLMLLSEQLAASRQETADSPVTSTVQRLAASGERLRGDIEHIMTYLRAPLLVRSAPSVHLSQIESIITDLSELMGLPSVRVITGATAVNDYLPLSRKALELALGEMIENSRKFHPDASPEIVVTVSSVGGEAAILIEDDGGRIPPEVIEKVWVPYFQPQRPTFAEPAGMGLGLAMVASIVAEAGGRYRIRNREPGPGVSVEIMLPFVPAGPTSGLAVEAHA